MDTRPRPHAYAGEAAFRTLTTGAFIADFSSRASPPRCLAKHPSFRHARRRPLNTSRDLFPRPPDPLPFEDVCQKDVPANTPYLIVEDDVIPSDRSFRNAWEADFSNPDGYGIGPDAWFAKKAAAEAAAEAEEVSE